ncbi:hypothetical protein [Xenorhabdus innexi]|uniref:DUF7823 domain-containing protein n=1 Tax=Xenorhabdus innexi TaxID=290109 RepID=A0A1N6MWC7_9GAMM|nr:hypothetical protein [Xenorhabdus innexi]PHM27809.1 hypothetical protein Xinn_03928 [Xenorhabdus innexi]SIP73168.1 conserved hypothetical protein [Xenorhabdus innexi]
MSDVNKLDKVSEINNMLTIDITLGMARWWSDTVHWVHFWGYQGHGESDGGATSCGSLVVIENNTPIDVARTNQFRWWEFSPQMDNTHSISWDTYSYDGFFQKTSDLFSNKVMYVTVDGITYNLGKNTSISGSSAKNGVIADYISPDAPKLGNILKQIGVTKRFYFNWRDE